MKTNTLTPALLHKMDAYWRAANYLSAGQIYLYDNPLLKRPLTLADVKHMLLGHWGTTPGQNFIYVHLNRAVKKYDLDMIYVSGPGHGGPAVVGNTYLEGTYSEIYPNISQDEAGLRKLFIQFSFPGGIPSHASPECPGSIHEGGELGYSLSHSFGAGFDNPDLVVDSVVGDGEAETGPLATARHSNKFLDPAADGAVLPILHLNGYKISNPTVLARITREELEQLLRGYGWTPCFVEGHEPELMHEAMTAMFAGILNRAFSTVTNIGATMWIMDPAVNTATSAIPMPDYLLDAVRSMDGVSYAVPLFIGGALVKLDSGTYQSVNVVGLDDTSLFGRPELEQGNIQDLYADNAFMVVNDAEFSKLEDPKIGTVFELNDHRGVIVGIAKVASNGLNGVPTLYTTYSRAIEYIPTTRFTISYVLVQAKSDAAVAGIKQQVAKLGYIALTKDEFNKQITNFYTYKTGIGTNILLMTVISFIVGLSISGQTFYTFILENLEKFGALKAIGAKGRELVYMILFMAT